MPINRRLFIYKVLKDSNTCKALCMHYDGKPYQTQDKKTERSTKIKDGSME